jgi:hypothetical protein
MLPLPLLLAVVIQAPVAAPEEVAGRVVDAQGQPVAGTEVLATDLADGMRRPVKARATSDPQGRFRVTVPDLKDARMANLPLTFWAFRAGLGLGAVSFTRSRPPKEDAFVVRLGAPGGTPVRVLGPDGAPVARARVSPLQSRVDSVPGSVTRRGELPAFPVPDELADRLATTTGPDGRGRIGEFAPGSVQFAWVGAPGFGRQQIQAAAGADGSLTFTLAPVGRLVGRLVADDPKVVRGLTVHIFTRPDPPRPGAASSQVQVVADDAGRFEVAELAAGRLFLNAKVPDGSGLSPRPPNDRSVAPGRVTEVTIPVKMPVKTRSVVGRVVDTRGQPVPGATVLQTGDTPARTSTQSDAQGRFTLPGVASGPTFLFARAKGFRFSGQALKAGDVVINLTREDEKPTTRLVTLPPASTAEQERALARRLIDPYAERVLKEGDQNDKISVLNVLARVDPARVLAVTEGPALTEPFLKMMFRLRVAEGLLISAQDEALAVVESIEDPGARANGLLQAVDALPESERARKLELLDRALADARAAREPTGIRLIAMAQVAEHWLDLGLTEKGTKLLREAQPDAAQLPDAAWPGYAKGAFAEELAQVDLDAALKLTKGLANSFEFDRHHGNIAQELAARDPASAERVLEMVRDRFQRDQHSVGVVYRMARVDLARARRLAAAVHDPALRGYALGMAALGLAECDRKADAAPLLAAALETLEQAATDPRTPSLYAATAPTLLPVAERIDPALVPETFWRVLSLRAPKPVDLRPYDAGVTVDLRLALMLARYDRSTARVLLTPYVGPEAPSWVGASDRGIAFVAAAVIDPAWAVSLIEALPDDPGLKFHTTKNEARLAVAAVLVRRGEARWRYLQYHFLNLSPPDIEDIAAHL